MQTDKLAYAVTNRRKQTRYKIEYDSIIVFDLEIGEHLGCLENLTMDGFLLKSDKPLNINKTFRVSISLPDFVNQKSVIRCSAKSLWGDEVNNLWGEKTNIPDYYQTGFEFLAFDEGDTETLALLIDQLGTPL